MKNTSRLRQAVWLVLLSAQWLSVSGNSAGAPSAACSSMVPAHRPSVPQTSQAPFTLTPGGASVDGGQKISITLATASPQGSFKGFFLQARDSNTSQPVGTFDTTDENYRYVTCGNGVNNAITHANKNPKVSVVVEWSAPDTFGGEVAFTATAVQDYSTFWTGITSEKVTVRRSATAPVPAFATTNTVSQTIPPTTATEGTTSAPAPSGTTKRRGLLGSFRGRTQATTRAKATTEEPTTKRSRIAGTGPLTGAMESISLGCGVNKGCFGLPAGCTDNCDAMITYSKAGKVYRFEVMGKVTETNAFVAGALSSDSFMGDDSVMACRTYEGVVDIFMTWNQGQQSSNFVKDPKLGLANFESTQVDGKIYCRFEREALTQINKQIFDLENTKFHILVSRGPLTQDGSLSYHDDRLASAQPTSLSEFDSLGGVSDLFITLHASFMVAGWVGSASTGILLARYFKDTWRNNKPCGIDQWFHWHRMIMGTTWGLAMAAVILIFIHLNYSWTSIPADQNPHAYLGIVSIALCFIQPFMAMCRCSPNDSRRPVFNWVHWFVGNASQSLAITAIFYGLDLHKLPKWTWWVMIVFVGFHVIVHFMFSIAECKSDNQVKAQATGMAMKEFNSSRDMLQPSQDALIDAPGGAFRKGLLAFYLFIIWLLVAIMLLVIIAGEDQLIEWGVIFWE